MYNKKEREYYNLQRDRACKRLGITKNQYNWLRRKGEDLRKVYEKECNGELCLSYDNGEYDNFVKPYYKKIDSYIENLGLKIFYQTDPRGASLYLDTKQIPENNYIQAVCIY